MYYQKGAVLLSAKNVQLAFKQKGKSDKVIFKDINFEVNDIMRPGVTQGQVVSLVGRSGIGKSTMIRLLAGLPIRESVVTGSILINTTQTPTNPGDMGIVPQNYYLPPFITVHGILKIAARNNRAFKGDQKVIAENVEEYLSIFELKDHMDKLPIQLSGGQKQRAAIACQLLYGSNFLLMDEPFSGLDPIMVDKTLNLLQRVSLMDELKTIIVISHDLRNCVAISDTVLILSNRDRAPEEGATIVQKVDLIEAGLAWQPGIKDTPLFLKAIRDIKTLL